MKDSDSENENEIQETHCIVSNRLISKYIAKEICF